LCCYSLIPAWEPEIFNNVDLTYLADNPAVIGAAGTSIGGMHRYGHLSTNLNEHTLELMNNPIKPRNDEATRFSKERPGGSANKRPQRAKPAGRPKPAGGGKLVLKTLDEIDGRTFASRRAHQLIDGINRDLGVGADDDPSQLSTGVRQLVQAAAVLGAMIENDQANWMSGVKIDTPSFLAALGMQRRILTTLGLERRGRDVTPPTLEEIKLDIAARHAADAKELDGVLNPDASIQQRIDAAAQRDEVAEHKRDEEAAQHHTDEVEAS